MERSLPLRECGLKYPRFPTCLYTKDVTPFAGVWIEIVYPVSVFKASLRHSLCGSVD